MMVMDLYFLVYLSAPFQIHASDILDRVSGAHMQGMGVCLTFWRRNYFFNFSAHCIQGVTGGTDQTSGESSLGQTIPI